MSRWACSLFPHPIPALGASPLSRRDGLPFWATWRAKVGGLVVLGLIFAASAFVAINARIDAVLYLTFATLVAIWMSESRGRELLRKIWPGFIIVLAVIIQLIINPANLARVVGGFGQRSDFYDDPLPWVASAEVEAGSAFDWSLLWNNLWNIPGLWLGVFGGSPWGALGWLDTSVPQIVLVGTMTVLVGVIFLSMRQAETKKIIGVVATVGALWGMPLYLLQLGGFRAGEEVQPRYLLPLMMVFLGTMLLSRDGRPVISDKGRLWFVDHCADAG